MRVPITLQKIQLFKGKMDSVGLVIGFLIWKRNPKLRIGLFKDIHRFLVFDLCKELSQGLERCFNTRGLRTQESSFTLVLYIQNTSLFSFTGAQKYRRSE